MAVTHDVFGIVQEILVDSLGVEHEEVIREARFFNDLGGESIDVLDLTFRCEQRFEVPIRFQELTEFPTENGPNEETDFETMFRSMKEKFPFLDTVLASQDGVHDVRAMFTVDAIVQFIEQKLSGTD